MNKLFITLVVCALAGTQARFFRGGNLRDSADFGGAAHVDHTHEGDVSHKSAADNTEAASITYITHDIALNLGLKIPTFIDDQRTLADTSFDNGVTFCGAEFTRKSNGIESSRASDATEYGSDHGFQASAARNDGVVVDGTSEFSAQDEADQCGANNCLPNSIVHSIASFIRSQGYHVRHDDICAARSGTSNTESLLRTCNIDKRPTKVLAYSCPAKNGTVDQWKYDKECSVYGTDPPSSANYGSGTVVSSACDGATDCYENDDKCLATEGFLKSKKCTAAPENDIGVEMCGTAACKNQVKRVLKYGVVLDQNADIEDAVLVTGSADGCVSLRGLVLAINGAKLENTFISKQHEAAETYWKTQLDESRELLETIVVNIEDMKGLNQYFYDFENAPVFQCDSNFAPLQAGVDAGTTDGPKCDSADMTRVLYQSQETTESMGQRSNCFCRSLKAASGDTLSVDENYLLTSAPTASDCDAYRETLPSVYTFCNNFEELGDAATWKKATDQLKSSKTDMPLKLDVWYTATNNNGKRGKDEVADNFDNSISGSGTRCGRISSADPSDVSFSNKGGNCVPFQGVEHVVYRLEYEFFGNAEVDRKNSTGSSYADVMCEANPRGDQILSFRQLAYVWQRFNVTGNDGMPAEQDDNDDNVDKNPTGGPEQLYDGAKDNTRCGGACYGAMCSVDFAQLLGGGAAKEDAGTKVANPLDFYQRIAQEASENVHHTFSARNSAENAIDLLWERFQTELTDTEYSTVTTGAAANKKLVADIGKAATEHFMRVAAHSDASDLTGKKNMCAKKTVFTANVSDSALLDCDAVTHIDFDADQVSDPFVLGTLAINGAKNLVEAVLPKYTTVGMMSLSGVGDAEILFKTDKYRSGGTDSSVKIDDTAMFDTATKCGIKCDDDYAANSDPTNALCSSSTNNLNALYCEYKPAAAKINNATKDNLNTFITKQITRPTTIDATTCGTDSGVKVMEFYLGGGADCGTLTFADMSDCDELTHIYVHTSTVYGGYGQADGTSACSGSVDGANRGIVTFAGYSKPPNLKLFWTNGAPSNMPIAASASVVPQYWDSSNSSITELCVNDENYLVAGDATLSTGLTKECEDASEIVLPDSVRRLGVGFSIKVKTAKAQDLTIYVGERLQGNSNGPSIDDTATILPNNATQSAKIMRRCPSTNVAGYNHPGYEKVAAQVSTKSLVNAFVSNTLDSHSKSAKKDYSESRYYDLREGDDIPNCVTNSHA